MILCMSMENNGPQPQSPSPIESDASSTVYSLVKSNDSDGEQGKKTVSDHSVTDDPIPIPSSEQVTTSTQKTQPQVPKPQQTVDQFVHGARAQLGRYQELSKWDLVTFGEVKTLRTIYLFPLHNQANPAGQEEVIDMMCKTEEQDVKLSGTIDEEVYDSQPPVFVDPDHPTKFYKVVKSFVWILHQAPRDSLGPTNKSWCDAFEALMQSNFNEFPVGALKLTFFLGLQVKQNKGGIFISQDKYVAEILKKFDLVNVKAAITPMETKLPLTKDEEAFDVDVHLYRSMIGSLMYLTASRPDIMYAVCVCSRFQVTPKTSHLNAVKRIFKYLKGKPNLGLWYPRESPFDLEAFSDSDYGGSNLDRKSTTGGCQFLGQRLISWQCKKQTIVATSTTEAEYVAAANCCGQVLWVQNQLLDYGFNFMNTKIHIDNESTICIVKNPVYHSKTKHIEIRHHFIRDCYEKKLISVEKIHTDLNVADLLTKPFDGPRFNYLVVSIGFAEIVDFLRGLNLRYALTANPTIYDSLVKQFWQSAIANTKADGSLEINATIDTIRYTISEASIKGFTSIRERPGITMLPNDDLFEGMGQIGYPTDGTFTFWKSFFTPQWRYLVHHLLHCISSKSGGWDQFGSNIATALICLSTGRVYKRVKQKTNTFI
ncbi:putative ribonuclease H-like domain-containing protein [Tanacetum coccineum]|uniref:Ribonuclease H-like domain-containing protein n=1 Tax=Tanacetum coccineum TaxID=301880 RepID=A0ABQ5AWN8_9ASTR